MDDEMEFNEGIYTCPDDNICLECGIPMNIHDYTECRDRAKEAKKLRVAAVAMSNKQEAPVSRIEAPPDFRGRASRIFERLEEYAAVCVWCGHGYEVYASELEDEHFAYNCPEAPEQLRITALARLAADR